MEEPGGELDQPGGGRQEQVRGRGGEGKDRGCQTHFFFLLYGTIRSYFESLSKLLIRVLVLLSKVMPIAESRGTLVVLQVTMGWESL